MPFSISDISRRRELVLAIVELSLPISLGGCSVTTAAGAGVLLADSDICYAVDWG